jgi:hypothetical protein
LLDASADQTLDVERAQRRGHRVDLNLDGRRVGKGVERQPPEGDDARDGERKGRQDDDQPVAQREIDDLVQHRSPSRSSPRRCCL